MLYLEGVAVEKWFVYFLGLLDRLKDGTADEVLLRLAAPARIRERVRQYATVPTIMPSSTPFTANRTSNRAASGISWRRSIPKPSFS